MTGGYANGLPTLLRRLLNDSHCATRYRKARGRCGGICDFIRLAYAGPSGGRFRRGIRGPCRAPHACAVANCTVALHLALLAIGVGQDDEVITVSHTFIATANAIRQCGAVPVFIDIDPTTFNMAPHLIKAALTPRTKAILCVHQIGMPCDLNAILSIARSYGLPVIEDAACAIGSEICVNGAFERIGKSHADIACFSLHPRKILTVGDGGMITTQNSEWDGHFRLLRQHGMDVSDAVRHGSRRVVIEQYSIPGYNYRMTDMQAAVGREQLKRLPDIVARRRKLAEEYRLLLSAIPGVVAPTEPEWAKSNWQSYCVRLPPGASQIKVMQHMLDHDVATRRGIMCVHLEPAYEQQPLHAPLPESEKARDGCILLPLFPEMTAEMQLQVVEELNKALRL